MAPATDRPVNPPVYVASVTYGRELWVLVSSQETEETLEVSLKASFSGLAAKGTIETEAKNRHVLRESKVNAFVLGGSLVEATPVLLGDPEKGLEGYIKSGASFSKKSPGAVITYQTRYLGTGHVAKLSSATQYTVPRPRNVTKLRVTYHTYDEDKDPGAAISLFARANGEEVGSAVTGNAADLWKDYTIHGPYEITLSRPVPENSIPKMEVQVRQREGGNPAWRMRFHVEAVFDRGNPVVVLDYADPLQEFNHKPGEDRHKCFDLRGGQQDTPWVRLRLP
jgi:hypothetical protein